MRSFILRGASAEPSPSSLSSGLFMTRRFPAHFIAARHLRPAAACPADLPQETAAEAAAAQPGDELPVEEMMARRSSSWARSRAARWSATSRRRMCSTRATSAPPARPASTSCWTRSRRRPAARAGAVGGRPIVLLNGLRISGFREIRDLPPEAIERMEILPEEVALKYGYAADQRVVNIVLRRRFNSTNVELRGRAATDGGYVNGRGEAGRLIIADGTQDLDQFQGRGQFAAVTRMSAISSCSRCRASPSRSTRARSVRWSDRATTCA